MHEFLPLRRCGSLLILAASGRNPADQAWLRRQYGPLRLRILHRSVRDLHRLIAQRFHHELTRNAVSALAESQPQCSARTVMTRPQWAGLAAGATAMTLLCLGNPKLFLSGVVLAASMGFLFGAATRFALAAFGPQPTYRPLPKPHRPAPCAAHLPVYTVLVPLYREANVLPALAARLAALDYPQDRLDIKFLVEEDDTATRLLAESLARRGPFTVVTVPPSSPRTKPKACNYALPFARGEFLVIFDAEDRPEPDQLRKAVQAFRHRPEISCLQARLAIHNGTDGFLPALFALDYDIWFTALLPGLSRLAVPMPLGGTSNHFRTEVLRLAGGWDPYNVTEDADLGIRLARRGCRVAMLESETREEAPVRFSSWLRQRTRWLKGYMQTLLVHLRAPRRLYRDVGPGGSAALILFLGGTVAAALLNPILWLVFLTTGLTVTAGAPDTHLHRLAFWSGTSLMAANMFLAAQVLTRQRGRTKPSQALYGLAILVYWMLISVAAWRGAWQLLRHPHLWEKTPHGAGAGAGAGARAGAESAS